MFCIENGNLMPNLQSFCILVVEELYILFCNNHTHTYTHYFMRTIQCLKKYKLHEINATELLGTIFCLSKCQVPLLSSRCIGPLSSTFGSFIFIGGGIMCRGLTVLWHVHYYLCRTVRSESHCALRLRYVDLAVSIEVALEVCCCCVTF